MNDQLTPWFPADLTPVRNGVYEVSSEPDRAFAYWNGSRFGYRCWMRPGRSEQRTVKEAYVMREAETCLPEFTEWRGLANPPKEQA